MKNVIFVLFFLLVKIAGFSQSLDVNIFNELCTEFNNQNLRVNQRKVLHNSGVFLEEDIVSGQKEIRYGNSTSSIVVQFKQMPLKKQLQILLSEELPIFPLGDTVLVYDKQNFFPADLIITRNCVFKVIEKLDSQFDSKNIISIDKVTLRGNDIVLLLSFFNDETTVTFCCTLNNCKISSSKMRSVGDW